jgi:hypothetical protein
MAGSRRPERGLPDLPAAEPAIDTGVLYCNDNVERLAELPAEVAVGRCSPKRTAYIYPSPFTA